MSGRLLAGTWKLADVDVEMLARKAVSRSGIDEDTDEVLSFLFERFWRAWSKWDATRSSAGTYIFLVCRAGMPNTNGKHGAELSGGSRIEFTPGPSPSSSASTQTIPSEIAWDRLSDTGAWRVTHLAFPISCGVSKRELGDQLGETTGWVTKQLDALRDELERLG